ncbi:MAG: Obg family GTPase CgtA, partial [Paludibacteraceae bacterium]|nr:Obg family GTPase CgtA [Paludibacteraceae bacterium]
LMDVTEDGEQKILLKGGRGGLGNWHFRSATNRTPRFAQSGEPGQERIVILELKVLADVGLVGKPNAGKSTLLSSISAAKPKIADYPFTTLVPNLGIVAYRDGKSFCMADIPGIIEGASEGKGLGYRFLRHIERNAILCFLVPVDTNDIVEEYNTLLKELEAYNPELLEKQRILCLSKSDMLDDELKELISEQLPKDIKYCFISSVVGTGLTQLKDMLWEMIQNNTHEVESITHRNLDADKIRYDFDDDDDFSYVDESPNDDNYDEYEFDEEVYEDVMNGKIPSKFNDEEVDDEEELVDYVEDEDEEEIVDYIEEDEEENKQNK